MHQVHDGMTRDAGQMGIKAEMGKIQKFQPQRMQTESSSDYVKTDEYRHSDILILWTQHEMCRNACSFYNSKTLCEI